MRLESSNILRDGGGWPILARADRPAPVIIAAQGHSMEDDLLDEARLRPEIFSVFHKSAGTKELETLIRDAAIDRRRNGFPVISHSRPLYELFSGRRGQTAGRRDRLG